MLYISYGYYTQYKNTKTIEPIIPLVFYHGKKGWQYKPIEELPKTLQKEVMTAYDRLIERGIQKGMQEGSTKKTIEVILNGYKKGATMEFLSEITEISIEDVKKILKENSLL